MNMASSMSSICPSRLETGSISSSVPHRITARKLLTINRVGLVFLRRALWESASARENPFNRTPHFACLHRIIGY